ncbi:MAG TPA: helicase [Bacteroidetes bacterium]|nr:helicase [Bacteroidota bacterium]
MNFISNPQIELAFDYVRNTDKNIFLTGKAGTGKTTFLHQIKAEAIKRMAVVAPTGVAAINAGGMTIHSLFQLPFGPLPPGRLKEQTRNRKFGKRKINLIKSLDLLVIDEISMVRADVLDAIDEVLRRYRDFTKPFGGVQLLMIGDLHQLPPVVKREEEELLRQHYRTAYFFGSIALRNSPPVVIELKHIYRQSDGVFIKLLNKVRDNQIDREVLETLNSRYRENFRPKDEEGYITLTSHNAAAQRINAQKLESIEAPVFIFKAEIKDDFPPHAYPTQEVLELKTGAQVMFVKNDISPEKLYYNGKIGQITKIDDGDVYVKCPGDDSAIIVNPVVWDNVKFKLDEKTKEVNEEIAGSFRQYPLKLAWAITIHKSQGLTFERAIIDAQAAFAHGQVYVALSRCKSFEGIVLRSKIIHSSVRTDVVVKNYSEEAERNAPTEADLEQSKSEYQQALITELFDFKKIKTCFDKLHRVFLEHENSLQGGVLDKLRQLVAQANSLVFKVANNFRHQLSGFFQQPGLPSENGKLQERIKKAAAYFSEKINKELLPEAKKIQIVTDNKSVGKTAKERLEDLQKEMFVKNACLATCLENGEGFSVQKYIRTKANAELDFQNVKKPAPVSGASSWLASNATHPDLYVLLSKWRRDLAEDMDLENYRILPTKSLLELVQYLPTTTEALKRIKGIGDYKIKSFGADIIGIIEKYCSENNITPNQLSILDAAPRKLPKTDTKMLTLNLFKSGKNIDEIAAERGLVRGTIEGHLGHFISTGEVDIFKILEREKVDELEAYFKENNTTGLGEVKAHFGEKYSYGEIKMVLEHLKLS